jgi:hypothetical protein
MTNDIVAQLRSSDFCSCEIIYRAADRIEQLTNERDKAARLGKSGGYKATPEHSWAEWCDELYRDLNKANDRIEQLKALIALIEDLDPNVMDEARAALEGKDEL